MGKNTKPMLTVLVEGDKLQQFRDYALAHNVSMGWVVNRLIDRVLSGDLDVLTDLSSTGSLGISSTGVSREDVEKMIKDALDEFSTGISPEYIESLINTSIDNLDIESLHRKYIDSFQSDMGPPSPTETEELDIFIETERNEPPLTNVDAPNWLTKDNRAHYHKLVGKPERLDAVTKLLSNDIPNKDLPPLLVEHGFTKRDGSEIDPARISHIRFVVNKLNGVGSD